ncbi:acyltransferase family protein [Microbacterium sp. A93]|uniref:acyltransferase family protein n=1 Tax=Microbacterium sp. A93 TaxID=3450716 RepID=UPI003F439AC9
MVSTLQHSSLPRLDSLTGLRWWAAFAVFLFHIRNLVTLPPPIADFVRFGNFGVAFFFILSGFVLTWSWRESVGIGTFYWRRFARIYPLHLVTLLIAIPVFYSFTPDPAQTWVKPVDWAIFLLCLLMLQGWSRDATVMFAGNPASWTLTAEAFFYSLHPFITKVLRLLTGRGALVVAVGVAVLSILGRIVIITNPTGWFALLPWPVLRLNEFLVGMCLAWAFRAGWRLHVSVWVPVSLILAYLVGVSVLDRFALTRPLQQVMAMFTSESLLILFSLLICAAASNDLSNARSLAFRSRFIVILGEWSYAFYLIHATLIYLTLAIIGHRVSGATGLLLLAVLLVGSIVAAGTLHVWIERPVERMLRAWQNRKVVARKSVRDALAD